MAKTAMRILLGSGGFRTPERIALLTGLLREHFQGAKRVLFIPYALADHDGYVLKLTELGLNAGYDLDGIHRHVDPQRAVAEAEAVYVGGGNTFRLVDALYRFNLIDPIRQRVQSGMPFFGVSAGANVACPTMKTTNDMPIVMPPSFETLGLVPFQINPHYFGGGFFIKQGEDFVAHFGETRDDRLREFHEMNQTPVVGLWEGGVLRMYDGGIELLGAPARIFRPGVDPVDVDPPADLTSLLPA
jgi:dipeptidase E